MNDEEVERKIHIAGALGCAFGFASGAGLMALGVQQTTYSAAE